MKYRIHRDLAERIREGCEGRLNVRINPRWFGIGNVYPDCSHQRLLYLHEIQPAGKMVGRMIRRFCKKSIYSGQILSRWRSFRLGIVMHYICDFLCYVHSPAFEGSLMEHRAYEQEQGKLTQSPQMRDVISFYGAENADELFNMLIQTIRRRDSESFSPAGDLDFALSIGTELAYAMLRISMGSSAHPPLRYRLPIVGHRLLRSVSYAS